MNRKREIMVKHWKWSLLAAAAFAMSAMTAMTATAERTVANGDQTTSYPSLKSMPAPEYPQAARDAKIEGRVLVRALVGVDGRVEEAFLVDGDEIFAASAIEAVSEALFEPATKDGDPIEVWVSAERIWEGMSSGPSSVWR